MPQVKRTRLVIPRGKNSLQDAVPEVFFEEVSQEEFDRMFGSSVSPKAAFLQGEGEVRDADGNLKHKIVLEGRLDGSNTDDGSS